MIDYRHPNKKGGFRHPNKRDGIIEGDTSVSPSLEEEVICKECQAEGRKSRIHPGTSTSSLVVGETYYDEAGKYHNHDPNSIKTWYSCSNGHSWREETFSKCWCGWSGDPKKRK